MRIVLIDGDRAHLRSLEILLTELGHAVTTFHSPRSACRSLGAADVAGPEVLIAEQRALQSAGDQVMRRLRDLLARSCRVILLSGDPPETATGLVGMGVSAVFPKPVDYDLLRRTLE